jgi:hypothetical protein
MTEFPAPFPTRNVARCALTPENAMRRFATAAKMLEPPPGSARGVVATIPPESAHRARAIDGLDEPRFRPTRTVDRVPFLDGPQSLALDERPTERRSGDGVVQRATRDVRRDRGGRPARLGAVRAGVAG